MRKGLWQNPEFLKLWGAYSTSAVGTQLASLAYSLTAIITLQASAMQVGVLRACGPAAAGLMGLFAGVMADRVNRKGLLIWSDIGRALLALSIPAAFFLGFLRIEHLFITAFLTGLLGILSDVGIMSYIPILVKREELIEANSRFATTDSIAMMAGTGASGALVQALTAPVAIIVDALSFIFSAGFLLTVRGPEPSREIGSERKSIWKDIGEGLSFVYRSEILRPLAQEIALHFYFFLIFVPIFDLYAIRELGFEPLLLGLVISVVGVGFMVSAIMTKRITARLGIGRTMLAGSLLTAIAVFLIPIQGPSKGATVAVLVVAHFLLAVSIQTHGINLMSLRQAVTPDRLQGRMNASFRVVNVCMIMLGSLTGGFLAERIGFRATIIVAAFGLLVPFLRLLFSPVRTMRENPAAAQILDEAISI